MAQPLPTSLDPINVFMIFLQHLVQRFRQMNGRCRNPIDWAVAANTRTPLTIVSLTCNELGSYSAVVRLCRIKLDNFSRQEIKVQIDKPYVVITGRRTATTASGQSYVAQFVQHRLEVPFGAGIMPSFSVKQDSLNPDHSWVSLFLNVDKQDSHAASDEDDNIFDMDFMT